MAAAAADPAAMARAVLEVLAAARVPMGREPRRPRKARISLRPLERGHGPAPPPTHVARGFRPEADSGVTIGAVVGLRIVSIRTEAEAVFSTSCVIF